MQVDLVFRLVGPSVFGVKDLGVNAFQGLGVLEVEDGKGFELSIGKRAIVNGVYDATSSFDADALSRKGNTLPYPYLPPVHPVLTSQTWAPC